MAPVSSRKYVLWTVGVTLAGLAALVGVNSGAGALERLRTSRIAAAAAAAVLDGRYVAFAENLEDRVFQIEYVARRPTAPDAIVFGSSRSMQIRPAAVGTDSFFNHSAWGSNLIDYLGIFELYERMGSRPKVVVLGVDPWVFNRHNDQTRWWPLAGHSVSMVSRLRQAGTVGGRPGYEIWLGGQLLELGSNLLSKTQLEFSWRVLKDRVSGASEQATYYVLDSDDSDLWVKRPDGSIRYMKKERDKTAAELLREAREFAAQNPIYGFREYMSLDRVAVRHFEGFVRYLGGHGVEVILFLSPLHPAAYTAAVARPENRMLVEAEHYLRKFAGEAGLKVVGAYDGTRAGCAPDRFIDAHHPDQACVEIMFRAAGMGAR